MYLFSIAQVSDVNGKNYKTVVINNKIYMAENLNVSNFRNGDSILEAKTTVEWLNAINKEQPAWCYYNNDPKIGEEYGKHYNWYAINDSRGLAPIGWHIAKRDDWNYITTIDDLSKLKSKNGWTKNGSNTLGFSALPGGLRCGNGKFLLKGSYGFWWSAEQEYSNTGGAIYLLNSYDSFFNYGNSRGEGFSVRCVKD